MAVTRRDTSGVVEYYGLSGDTKPTATTTAGSTFLETDTGQRFLYTGSAWVAVSAGSTTLSAGSAIIGKVGIDQTTPGTTDSVTVSTAQGAGATIGAAADAAVAAGAAGTLSAKLRSISRDLLTNIVLAASSNIIGKVNVDQTAPGTANSQFTTAITASTAVSAKASAGNLYSVNCTNANATVRYLQIHDKASAPSAGNVPVAAWPIPAGSTNAPGGVALGILEFGTAGYRCATGVAIGISTTLATYTAATAADHILNGSYV